MNPLALDLMELADVGAQPRKLAAEILRQLRLQYGEVPLPVPLGDIARAAGITEIIDRETEAFDGMLVAKADRSSGVIVLRAGMPPGRRNFTLGHEIGHLVNTYHKPPAGGFVCTKSGMNARRSGNIVWEKRPLQDRMEIEANEFSIALSIPVPEYRRERDAFSGCDLAHIEPLAKTFGLSKEAFAKVYVDTAPDNIAIFTSKNGMVERFIIPDKFPYLGLSKGHPLPSNSFSAKLRASLSPGNASALEEVHPDIWLDRSMKCALYEQVLAQRDGWAMTMLLVEEASEEELEEDFEITRQWSEPKFAYDK